MNETKLKSPIFSSYKLLMEFFMYTPEVSTVTGSTTTFNINMNPMLMMRYKQSRSAQPTGNFKDDIYKITPKNLLKVTKFFNLVVGWFYNKDMSDLFLRGEDNELIFNADYNKLSAISDRSDKANGQALKAVPNVIHFDDGSYYEGIYLYVNKIDNVVPLKLSEVEEILGILANFSFYNTAAALLSAYYNARATNSVTSEKRLQDQWHK